MQRELYKYRYFNEGQIPKWRCPTCSTGTLLLHEKLFRKDDAATQREINEDYFEPDWIKRVFTGALSCATCGETVVISGSGGVDREPTGDGNDWEWVNFYVPHFFYPALKLIDIPNDKLVPVEMTQAVEASFMVFWTNLDACANRLRTAIELLLDGMGVHRKVKQAATKELTLQQRIERIDSERYPHIQEMLMAIKLVGNDGSHDLGQASRDDILDCYEILEHVLELVYPPPSKTALIAQMAQKLIAKNPKGKKAIS
nr:DUF4145 domain-containing protein [uncultured Duganella sp.]